MVKQLLNVIYDIAIALRIDVDNFAHASAIDTLYLRIFIRTSSVFSAMWKTGFFRKNVVIARAELFSTVYVLM